MWFGMRSNNKTDEKRFKHTSTGIFLYNTEYSTNPFTYNHFEAIL